MSAWSAQAWPLQAGSDSIQVSEWPCHTPSFLLDYRNLVNGADIRWHLRSASHQLLAAPCF